MKKYIIILSLTIILFAVFLSGCNEETKKNGEKKTFIGTWKIDLEGSNQTLTFNENKTVILSDTFEGEIILDYFTWEDTGFELCMITLEGERRCGTYEFSNNFNTFTWSVTGRDFIYHRVN